MNDENWRGSLYEVFEDPVSYDSDCSILSDESDMLIADNCTFVEEIDRVLSKHDSVNQKVCDNEEKRLEPTADVSGKDYEFIDDITDHNIPFRINKISKVDSTLQRCSDRCVKQNVFPQLKAKLISLKSKPKKEIKQFLLTHLHSQENLDIMTDKFQFYGTKFCFKAFQCISGLSAYLISEACKAFVDGRSIITENEFLGYRDRDSTFGFKIWMKQHAENYGNRAPDEETLIIPGCYSIRDLFEQYESEAPLPRIKKPTFYRLFHTYFGANRKDKSLPHIRISNYSSHGKCDHCLLLEKFQRSCKSRADLELVKSLKQAHRKFYKSAYDAIQEKRLKSIYNPSECIFIQVDDMDNTKSFIPHSPHVGKSLCGLFRLPSKITGCIVWSGDYCDDRKVNFFINHNQFEQNGSKVVSIIYRLIMQVIEDFGKVPECLFINLDNCWR